MQTTTSADGTRIAYERTGTGSPLVLLHGGGGHEFWAPLVPAFAESHAVYAPDRRGVGRSGDAQQYAIEREVADARAVVAETDADPVLFGHSFGGLQALEAAREADVAGVVAYEPPYLVGAYREEADLAARMQARLDDGDRRGAMKLHLREVLHGDAFEDFDAWLEEWPAWPEAAENVEGALRMDRALEDHHPPDALDLDVPVLLLTGTRGPPHLRDSVRAVRDALADARLVEFDGLGHLGPVEDPERVVDAVERFVVEVTPTADT